MKSQAYKLVLTLLACFSMLFLNAQDSLQPVEPDRETSFENTELLIVALVGLAVLLVVYFIFRRRRKTGA